MNIQSDSWDSTVLSNESSIVIVSLMYPQEMEPRYFFFFPDYTSSEMSRIETKIPEEEIMNPVSFVVFQEKPLVNTLEIFITSSRVNNTIVSLRCCTPQRSFEMCSDCDCKQTCCFELLHWKSFQLLVIREKLGKHI